MYLPGLCAWQHSDPYCYGQVNAANRARATFGTLRAAMDRQHLVRHELYFSYNPSSAAHYTVNDTHQTVARAASVLEKGLRTAVQEDSQASFVLIGHSLGGVVAASWAVSDGRQYGLNPSSGLLSRVRSIITFDSPLRGIRPGLASNLVTRAFGGAVWYSLQPDSETIKEIEFFPTSWWRSHGHLHTVANTADRIVPASESELADSHVVHDASCARDLIVISSCHGAVLSDAPLNNWVVCHWVPGPSSCRPAPTATPTPSATPAASPTATAPSITPPPIPSSTPIGGGPTATPVT
ncbi:MAG TPA: hypothetical protein VF898_12770 [Chloroflexota bacterium]